MNLHLTYFGDNNFTLGKNRIRKQAENFGVFKSIQEFGEDDYLTDGEEEALREMGALDDILDI